MWGQEIGRDFQKFIHRIIPMRVGTSLEVRMPEKVYKDHPHACGDKLFPCYKSFVLQGSSPCVWGQVYFKFKNRSLFRIIPMRVGTRKKGDKANGGTRDHPHACGDKFGRSSKLGFRPGSSPCVWGQGLGRVVKGERLRIIPMRVGTSTYIFVLFHWCKDHPHACGDKSSSLNTYAR